MSKELSELCHDMLVVIDNMRPDLELVAAHEATPPKAWRPAAKLIRARTKVLAKMGLEFRKLSVILEKEEKAARKAAANS